MNNNKSNRLQLCQAGLALSLVLFTTTPSFAQQQQVAANDTTLLSTAETTMFSQQAASTMAATNAIMDRLAGMNFAPPSSPSGFSSGETALGINVWGNPFYTYAEDDNASTGYKSDTYGAFLGGDYALNKDYTVGLMFGFDDTETDSKVNGGGSDTFGFTVAPYARIILNKTYSVDATVGYTTSDSDNDRVATGVKIVGSSDTSRWFTGLGINGSYWHDRWNFLARAGTSLSFDDRDGFTESNGTRVAGDSSTFAQAQLGATAGYYFKNVRPWVSATYAYDYARELPKVATTQTSPSDDRDQVILGGGATVFGLGAVTGDVSVKHSLWKEKYDNTTVGLTLSTSF